MRFTIRQQADGPFVFELRDADRLLLESRPFADREAAVDAVRATIDAIEEAEGYEVEATAAGYVLRVTDAEDNVLAETPASAAEAEAASLGEILLDGAARTDDYEVTVTTTSTETTTVPLAFRSMRAVDPSGYYDFDRIGASRDTGGQAFQEGDQYYYVVNDAAGQPLLFTRHYGTAGQRNKRMRSVLEAAGRDTRYETVEEDGRFYFIVKARNGMEIARSRAFASAAAMTSAMGYLQGYAPDAHQAVKSTRRRSGSDSNDYDLTLTGTTDDPGFDAYRAGPGQFVFLFNDQDGQPILFSQGYAGRASRDNGIKSIIRNAGKEGRYELKEENGEHYFVLRAGNRREIARSRAFPTAAAAMAAMAFLQRQAPTYADQYGVVLTDQTRTKTETESFTIHVDSREEAGGGAIGVAGLGLAGAALAGDRNEETTDEGDSAVAGAAVMGGGLGAGTGAGVAGASLSTDDDSNDRDEGAAGAGATGAGIAGAALAGGAVAGAAATRRERVAPAAAAGGTTTGGTTTSGAATGGAATGGAATGGAATGGAATGGAATGGAATGGAATGGAATGGSRAYAASSATSGGCMKWLLPLLLALLLLLLLLWLLRGCEGCADVSGEDPNGVVEGDAAQAESDASALPPAAPDSMEADTTTAGSGTMESGIAVDTMATEQVAPAPEPEPEPEPEPIPEPEPAAAVPAAPDVSGAIVPRGAASGFDLDDFALAPGSMAAQLLVYLNGSEPAGRSFAFTRVNYPTGDHPIDATGAEQVFLIGEILKRFPNARATIHGHIDGTESETYTGPNPRGSMTLSQLRAHCVWQRLVYQGIPRSQIQMVGHADEDPIASDDTAAERQQNRRVEIEITRK